MQTWVCLLILNERADALAKCRAQGITCGAVVVTRLALGHDNGRRSSSEESGQTPFSTAHASVNFVRDRNFERAQKNRMRTNILLLQALAARHINVL